MTSADVILFELINGSWTSRFLDHLMPVISSLDVWSPFIFAGTLWILIRGGRSGRLFLLSIVIGLFLGDVIVSHNIKHAFNRPRPREARAGVKVRSLSPGKPALFHVFEPPVVRITQPPKDADPQGYSFPSSHVINFFMFAAVAFRFRRWAGFLLGLVGIAVAWSRIYCGAHWPSDIPPSMVIGILCGFAAVWLVRRVDQRVYGSGIDRSQNPDSGALNNS